MRREMTGDRLRALMKELAASASSGGAYRVYLVGGTSAVLAGWRDSSIDADLYSDQEEVFRDIQRIKVRLNINVEFARPEHFVPALRGTEGRHRFIETIGRVSFYHYDPYAQVLSKVVRGFDRDLEDARRFLESGMVEAEKLRKLVRDIPEAEYSKYPSLTPSGVIDAVEKFLFGT